MNGRERVNFEEFANTFMKEFFQEPATAENCDKLGRLVWAYLWAHPEFAKHREDVEAFWTKVGDAWEEIEYSYNAEGKL